MFKRDLIAKYGEDKKYGIQEGELRKALRFRRLFTGFISVLVLVVMVGSYFVYPPMPLWILGIVVGSSAVCGLIALGGYFIDNWDRNMLAIKRAKQYGVREED